MTSPLSSRPSPCRQSASSSRRSSEQACGRAAGRRAAARSSARSEPLAEANAWLAHYRSFYEGSLDRLGEHLAELQQAATGLDPDSQGVLTMVELEFVRTYAAPLQLVWEAWTDPDQIAKWWGPRGVSTPRESIELDLRPGCRRRFDMVDDATGRVIYPNSGTVIEVEPPSRIVWADDGFPDGTGKGEGDRHVHCGRRSGRRRYACMS